MSWAERHAVPPAVAAAFERALADLQGDDPIALRVTGYAPDADGATLVVQERGELGSDGLWIPDGEAEESLVVHLADLLQEQVFPESAGAWGEARPPCPGHGHPAAAELVDGQATWVCPASGARLGRIGGD